MPRTDCHGDPLPEGAVARIGTIRWRHPGASFVAYTPDGKLLVSVSSRDVRIWDVGTGRQIRRITTEGQRTSTRCATLSRDGTLLAFTVDAEAIVLIDLKTGTECRRIKTSGLSLISVALSADARLLAARGLGESTVLLWDTTTGKRLADVREPSVEEQTYFGGILWPEHSVAFAPDGKRVAASGEPKVACCWDTATGKIVWQAKAGQPRPKSLAFSPDGTLVAWEHDENRIILANAATGKEERSLKADGSPQFLTFSPDGKLLAAACNDSAVRLWDVATGKALRALEGDLYAVNVVAFSPDGKTLTAPVYGCLRHWEVATGKERSDPGGLQGPLWAMAVSPDGALLVTADVMLGVRLWETATGKPAGKPLDEPAVIESPVISPDGKILAFWSGGREVLRLRDLTTGRDRALGGDFGPLAFLPDGRLVAAGPREAAVWDPARGKLLRRVAVPGDEDRNIDVILAGAGGAVASFHEAGAQVREILTDRLFPECRVTAGRVTEAALSRDHRMIALRVAAVKTTRQGRTVIDESKPAVISVREVATGRERCRLAGIATEAGRPTFGPDWQLLALAHGDRICVWHVPTAKEVARLKGHDGAVFALAFSADSRRLISSSTDTTALVWDLAPLRQGLPRPAELTAHQRDAIWADLADEDAAKAYQAVGRLASSKGGPAILKERLLDSNRGFPDLKRRVARLIASLDAEPFEEREKASEELRKVREDAEPMLRQALAGGLSAEARRRIAEILQGMQGTPPGRDMLRTLRAIEALEVSATDEAREALEALAKGAPDARLTQEAKAALKRLTPRSATP